MIGNPSTVAGDSRSPLFENGSNLRKWLVPTSTEPPSLKIMANHHSGKTFVFRDNEWHSEQPHRKSSSHVLGLSFSRPKTSRNPLKNCSGRAPSLLLGGHIFFLVEIRIELAEKIRARCFLLAKPGKFIVVPDAMSAFGLPCSIAKRRRKPWVTRSK